MVFALASILYPVIEMVLQSNYFTSIKAIIKRKINGDRVVNPV